MHDIFQNITNDADIVETHKELTYLAQKIKSNNYHISISPYINYTKFNETLEVFIESSFKKNNIRDEKTISNNIIEVYEYLEVFLIMHIIIEQDVIGKDQVLPLINNTFVKRKYTISRYLDGIIGKNEMSINPRNGLSSPHGSYGYKNEILKASL